MTAIPAQLTSLEQESPAAARLAEYASLAVRVDAGLLRRLRLALLPEADVYVESDLWFSAVVESRGSTGFQISPSVLDALRERLAKAPPDVRARIRVVLDEAHANASPAIRLEESVNALAVELGDDAKPAIEAELQRALRTMATSREAAADIARWAVHAASRLHPIARDTATARALFLAASLTLRVPRPAQTPAPAVMAIEQLAWPVQGLLQELSATPTRLVVAFVAGGVQFRVPDDDGQPIEVPATDPVLVQLEWLNGTAGFRELYEVGASVVVPLEGDPAEVTLTTLAGDQYKLSAREGPDRVSTLRRQWPPMEFFAACKRLSTPGAQASRTAFAVAPDLLITSGAGLNDVPYLLDANGDAYFVLPRTNTETDGAALPDLVALRPTVDVSKTLAIASAVTLPAGEVRLAVPGFDGADPRWRDAVLEPSIEGAPAIRRGVVHKASPDDLRALAGAPVFRGEVAGALVALTAVNAASTVAHVEVVENPALQTVITRGREQVARHKAASLRVFVSSALVDMVTFRDVARDALLRSGHVPVAAIDPWAPVESALSDLDASDVYVGIIGWRYGFIPDSNPDRLSITHLEYRRAREQGKPCLIFLAAESLIASTQVPAAELTPLSRFREELRANQACSIFESADQLRAQISASVAFLHQESTRRSSAAPGLPDRIERLVIKIADVKGSFEFIVSSEKFSIERVVTAKRREIDAMLANVRLASVDRIVLERLRASLMPPGLQSAVNVASEVELRLDPLCAGYPWELLLARSTSGPSETMPAIMRSPLIDRKRAMPATSRNALILADANHVVTEATVRAIRDAEFDVELAIAADLRAAVNALFRHDYSSIYVAGHADVDLGPQRLPGIVFGNGLVGVAELQALRRIPQVVFVRLTSEAQRTNSVDVAARFAMGLQGIGVGAVVCTAWAIDEAVTEAFAKGFFASLRHGSFATAVGNARRAIAKNPLDVAGFHCYGDPDFRLRIEQPALQKSAARAKPQVKSARQAPPVRPPVRSAKRAMKRRKIGMRKR